MQRLHTHLGIFQNARQEHGPVSAHLHFNAATILVQFQLGLRALYARPAGGAVAFVGGGWRQ